jgi:hypothetical protein
MSLRAVIDGRSVQSWDVGEADWLALKRRSRAGGVGLSMPCCAGRAVPKTGASGLRFFSHHRQGVGCSTGEESERHLRLKAIAAEAARRAGWDVVTEANGTCPRGDEWRADVLAEKAGVRVAIEPQVSPQDLARYRERQERYCRSGVFALWLAARLPAGYAESREMPIFHLRRAEGGEETVKDRPLADFLFDFLGHRYEYVASEVLIRAPACLIPIPSSCETCRRAIVRTPAVAVFPGEVRPGAGWSVLDLEREVWLDQANDLITARVARTGQAIGLLRAARPKLSRRVEYRQACPFCGALQRRPAASLDLVRREWRDPGMRDGTVRVDLERSHRGTLFGWVLKADASCLPHPPARPEIEREWMTRMASLRPATPHRGGGLFGDAAPL